MKNVKENRSINLYYIIIFYLLIFIFPSTYCLAEKNDNNSNSDYPSLLRISSLNTRYFSDEDDKVISDTASIKEANSLAGKMLRLNIKDKYSGLAEAAKDVVVSGIGEDDVSLDDDLRQKAVESFRALSWAFYEGSK